MRAPVKGLGDRSVVREHLLLYMEITGADTESIY